jgi:hypothetical protein
MTAQERFETKVDEEAVDLEKNKKADSAAAIASNHGVYLVAQISNTSLSIGTSTEITYKLYVSQSTGIQNWKELEKPTYEGFEMEEIEVNPMVVETEMFKGETYRYVVLNKAKLTSIEKGEFQFEPLKLNVTIEIPSDKRDDSGRPFMQTVNKNLETEAFTISVE